MRQVDCYRGLLADECERAEGRLQIFLVEGVTVEGRAAPQSQASRDDDDEREFEGFHRSLRALILTGK